MRSRARHKKTAIAGFFVLVIFVLTGLLFLYYGMKEIIEYNKKAEIYKTVEGRLLDYTLQPARESKVAGRNQGLSNYQLIYDYWVNGQEYQVRIYDSTREVPEIGSRSEIYYNPQNPQDAAILWADNGKIKILVGSILAAAPLLAGGVILFVRKRKKKYTVDVVGLMFGITCFAFGYVYPSSFQLPHVACPFFLLIGLSLCVKSVFFSGKKRKRRKKRC